MKLHIGLRKPKAPPLPEQQQIKTTVAALKSARAELKGVSRINIKRRQDIRLKILVLESHLAELRESMARKKTKK